jgi:hypothetical protein
MSKRHFLIAYRVRDGEAEYYTYCTLELADPDMSSETVAKDFLPQFWGDVSSNPKHGTADDSRWCDEAYWDGEMVRLVEVYYTKPISKTEARILNELYVACDITVDTVGRRVNLRP